jgi:plasmid stabilization system protein ParE
MSVDVRLRPEAEADLLDAASWYERQLPGLGHRFLDQVEAVLSAISETPLMCAVLHRETRRALVRRFPFGVFYQVDESGIVVVAVMHASRDPLSWKQHPFRG